MADQTANEEFLDAMVRHQILLLTLSNRMRRRIRALLNRAEGDLRRQLLERLASVEGGVTPANLRRAQSLMRVIRAARVRAWRDLRQEWLEELRALAVSEAEFIDRAVRTVSPAILDTTIPSTELLRALVTEHPIQGRLLGRWFRELADNELARIESAIMVGMVNGESPVQVSRRIFGTKRLRGADGQMEISRRNALSLARTAIMTVANAARREFLQANSDLFTEEMYVATLDSRTTPICRSLDNKTFPVGEGPLPPLHFNCRSLRVAVIDGVAIGNRPARNFTQRQLLREYTRANNLRAVTRRADLPRGHRGLFDDYARSRMRELTGQVPGDLSYQQWLGRQSASFQDDVLGPTRARLFRRGDLSLDRFVSREGHEYTLSELATRDRQAFLDAGLDPDDFT